MTRQLIVTAVGDALISRRLPEYQDDAYQGMLNLIRSADVAFFNMEIVLSDYEGSPVVESGGANISTDPRVAGVLCDMGFNLTAFANNHTLNYGEYACLRTLEILRQYDIVCAGAGRNLAEARMPAFLETLNGRVGLMGCASTFGVGQHAGAQTGAVAGRPGLNPQRYDRIFMVDQEHYDAIKRIADRTGAEKWRQWRVDMGFGRPPKREGELVLADRSFMVGDEFDMRTEPHEADLKGNTKSVSDAAGMSHLTIASIHAHEPKTEMWLPADFIIDFAHACVDAGADMVVGHGPHMLRGLEIYNGKPIFYSLGNFIFQHEYVLRVAADDYASLDADPSLSPPEVFRHISADDTRSFIANDRYWESVLPIVTFEDRRLTSISLHPLTLGPGQPWPDRGTPRLADPEHGAEILAWMSELSRPYGTGMSVRDGVGYVDL
jgi:poly-gamma-glutamate capsule biosynthesis protein CapA/YwtB (metallophosphatase superfamily)